ncbi:hypothetical protein GCM10011428_73300 [Streptomyces violaceus]
MRGPWQLDYGLTGGELWELHFVRRRDAGEQGLSHVVDLVSGLVEDPVPAATAGRPRGGVDDACPLDVLRPEGWVTAVPGIPPARNS